MPPGFKLNATESYDGRLIRSRYDDIKVWSTGTIPLQIFRGIFFGFSSKGLESYFFSFIYFKPEERQTLSYVKL